MNQRVGFLVSKLIYKELIINGALNNKQDAYEILELVKEHIKNHK
ncbi:hypothetical protein [Priestia taiwanensis]|uniref:Uncharacterized protein n=1 Tax=Priestia taiwanensis TaxID=1347902 RepID=A0A917AMH6_9BACI|nr:hypothetical protein [Priestia taiwanensis]MBM7361988.1 hypothetical protein [Priestia taiwanensis]GGE58558.1 hypothetical protein GCM10007140_06130 [Priestia taiwanensis]